MNRVKKPRHAWRLREGSVHLRWCAVCGVYEDSKTLRRETRSSVTLTNVTVYRPLGKPTKFCKKQPACVAGAVPATAPPRYVDKLLAAIEAMAGETTR